MSMAHVLLNIGAGGFDPPTEVEIPSFSSNVKVADVDDDGECDFLLANSAGRLDMFINNGDGTYTPTNLLASGGDYVDAKFNDVNNDGFTDVVVLGGSLIVFLGFGDGTFSCATD